MVLYIRLLSEIVHLHQHTGGYIPTSSHYHLDGEHAAIYDRKIPVLRGPNNSMNTGLKMTILGYLATMFTIGVNEMWHFWFVEEIFAVPNHWMFNMGVVVAFMGALAYVVRVYARLVELGAETPGENPYIAEMYKMALEGKLYSRSIP